MREIVLDGPGKNALNRRLMSHLRDELRAAAGAPVLLTGAGDAFSAGLDLKEVGTLDADGMREFLLLLEALCAELFAYPGPTVAVVNGHAIAGGCILALCCDWRVAADVPKAKLGLNEVALGLRFPPGILRIVRHRVPDASLTRVLLEAALFGPAEAKGLGLVDEVVSDARSVGVAALERLSKHPADAYAAMKRDLRGDGTPRESEMRRFADEVLPVWTSDELKVRIAAALRR